MAYSPLEGAGRERRDLLETRAIARIASRHDATAAQIVLAWLLRHRGVVVIPKAGSVEHVLENRGALDVALSNEDMDEIDRAFPAPNAKVPLEMR
jgi:diketogulonate reductase-like aldo/keto reductase